MYNHILCIGGGDFQFLPGVKVTYAGNFSQAKALIASAEKEENPFTSLVLPKKPIRMLLSLSPAQIKADAGPENDPEFWEFLEWMRRRGTFYPFGIYGVTRENAFAAIRDYCREMGFEFLD